LALAASAITAAGTIYTGAAANAQGKYEQRIAQQNADLERKKFADAQERGAIDIMRRYRENSAAIGRQRANAGAAGLDADFGSLLAGQEDTQMITDEDVYTIGRNTTREIEGYDINVSNFISSGKAARARGKSALIGSALSATGTLLGGATQFAKAKAG
jgi:hypothetical protein